MARPPHKRVEAFGTPLKKAGKLWVLSPCNPAGWKAPEPGKMGRELHSLGVVHHEGRMVMPALNLQEITLVPDWTETAFDTCQSGSAMNLHTGGMQLQQQPTVCRDIRVSIISRAPLGSGRLLKKLRKAEPGEVHLGAFGGGAPDLEPLQKL